jgi:hypothetical protein
LEQYLLSASGNTNMSIKSKKMKWLSILLLIIGTNSFAQTKPVKKTPVKKPTPKQVYFGGPPEVKRPSFESEELAMPQEFMWQINADTTLSPNSILKETIEISGGRVLSRASFKDETVVLKKTSEKNYNVEFNFPSVFNKRSDYDAEISKTTLTLTDKKTKTVRTFNIFRKDDKTIARLQDLETKRVYLWTPFSGAAPSM